MIDWVYSYVVRNLKRCDNFRMFDQLKVENLLPDVIMEEGEKTVGVYFNISGSYQDAIVISSKRLYMFDSKERYSSVKYSDICSVKCPVKNNEPSAYDGPVKGEADTTIVVQLKSNEEIFLDVYGGERALRNSFLFYTFLRRWELF